MARCRRPNWMVSLALLAACAPAARADEAAKPPAAAMLYLVDGDYFAGALQDSEGPDSVNWQAAGAVRPFQFPTSAIRAAYFPAPPHRKPAKADYCFELSGGDRVFGSLVDISADAIAIESARFGSLRVERSQIVRMIPWLGASGWEYSGPNGLAEWQTAPAEKVEGVAEFIARIGKAVRPKPLPDHGGWREEAGHLVTETPGDLLRKQIDLPPLASIELALSWTKKADFALVIAAGDDKRMEDAGVHLEVWNETLVLVRESATDADVASVCDLKTIEKGLNLQILIDQAKGLVSVHSLNGGRLAEIEVAADDDKPLAWISLRNQHGDVRLEQLVVSRWSGQLPQQVDVQRQRIHRADGSIVYGDIVRYDAAARQFILQANDGEKTVEAGHVSSVVLTPGAAAADASLRVGYHDGTRVSGQLAKVEAGKLHVVRTGIEQALAVPLDEARCLIGVARQADGAPAASEPNAARLELAGVLSHGALVDGKADEATSCLVWKPRLSATSSPLQQAASGRIVYRDPPPPPAPAKPTQRVERPPAGFFGAVVQAFSNSRPHAAPARLSGYPHALFLRAGDRIPCIVSRIDERGVHFDSSLVHAEMVPHDQIQALELVSAALSLAEEKRLRLLTLPRMQKNNPPTHLIASTSGDYLRARVQSMDAQSLLVETRLETKRLARGRVSRIIWLHPPATSDEPPPADDAGPATPLQIQAVRADGVRLTFVPQEFVNETLVGSSPFLGPCQVELKAVDRILFGDMIEQSSDESLYDEWRLVNAVEPQFVEGDAQNSAVAGLSSGLIGKPAPEVRLDLLDGGRFRLSEEKGRVVVLDFWATWCAPCMQGLPEVAKVAEEFDGVKYVAVNMQEDRATIAGALERLQLNPLVALDIDGAASERYEVTAIPQVVVIDAAGNVARMFIGADLNFAEQLRGALQQIVNQDASAAEDASGQ